MPRLSDCTEFGHELSSSMQERIPRMSFCGKFRSIRIISTQHPGKFGSVPSRQSTNTRSQFRGGRGMLLKMLQVRARRWEPGGFGAAAWWEVCKRHDLRVVGSEVTLQQRIGTPRTLETRQPIHIDLRVGLGRPWNGQAWDVPLLLNWLAAQPCKV